MASSDVGKPPVILFFYHFSPWSRKIINYLALRKIPYLMCDQPVTLPRPDLSQLGVKYRRIPVMSVGRDIYCDTLMILEKLEQLFPVTAENPKITADAPADIAMERLLEKWTDVVVFKYAAAAIPTSYKAITDPKFVSDRTELWGRSWEPEHQDSLYAEAIANLRDQVALLEHAVLGDGRKWVSGNDGPKMADVHAAWIFDWLLNDVPNAMPGKVFSKQEYPKTWAWIDRYRSTMVQVREDTESLRKEMDGKDVVKQILAGGFAEPEGDVDEIDINGLKKGDLVEGWPTDTGFNHKDRGHLVALTSKESVIATKSQTDGTEVRVHHPRWQFMIQKVKSEATANGS